MGNNGMNDSLALDDEDRLPWLEPAYEDDGDDEVSLLRLGALILAGLALLGLIVGGIYLIRNRLAEQDEPQVPPHPETITRFPPTAPTRRSFRVRATKLSPRARDRSAAGGSDASRLPEMPMTATVSTEDATAAQAPRASAPALAAPKVVMPVAKLGKGMAKPATPAAPAVARPVTPARTGGPAIQLGAYGTEALARL